MILTRLIKRIGLNLMINYYWTFKICARHAYTNISLYPAWGHVRVKINDEPTQSLGIKTGYPTRAVV